MSGHYRMARRWMDHPAFGREPFTRAQAWCWLIEMAAWKDRTQNIGKDFILVRRGEYATSVRFLAERWQWTRMKAQRFLTRLEKHEMIEKTGTASGTPYTVIRVCNYGKYQASNDEAGQQAGQERDSTGTNKKEREEREESTEGDFQYAFAGKVIRLTDEDLTDWRETYHGIPDLLADLVTLDAWCDRKWAADDPKRKDWWHPVRGMLNNKHQRYLAERNKPSAPPPVGLEL